MIMTICRKQAMNHVAYILLHIILHFVRSSRENKICGNETNFSVTSSTVVVASPNYPQKYGQSMDCSYVFSARTVNSGVLELMWDDFQLPGKMPDCAQDYVKVRIRVDSEAKSIRFCGSVLPFTLYSPNRYIRVDFRSGIDSPRGVFQMKVRLIKKLAWSMSDQQPVRLAKSSALSGVVRSLHYPSGYCSSLDKTAVIQPGPNKTTLLVVMDLNLSPSGTICSQLDDHIRLKGGNDMHAPFGYATDLTTSKYTCHIGSDLLVITSNHASIFVRFHARFANVLMRGFAVGYMIYDQVPEKSTEIQSDHAAIIIGTVIGVLTIAGIGILAFIFKKKSLDWKSCNEPSSNTESES